MGEKLYYYFLIVVFGIVFVWSATRPASAAKKNGSAPAGTNTTGWCIFVWNTQK